MNNKSKNEKTLRFTNEELCVINIALLSRICDIKGSQDKFDRDKLLSMDFDVTRTNAIINVMQQEMDFISEIRNKIMSAIKNNVVADERHKKEQCK